VANGPPSDEFSPPLAQTPSYATAQGGITSGVPLNRNRRHPILILSSLFSANNESKLHLYITLRQMLPATSFRAILWLCCPLNLEEQNVAS